MGKGRGYIPEKMQKSDSPSWPKSEEAMEMIVECAQGLERKIGKEMFTNLGHTLRIWFYILEKILGLETNSLL